MNDIDTTDSPSLYLGNSTITSTDNPQLPLALKSLLTLASPFLDLEVALSSTLTRLEYVGISTSEPTNQQEHNNCKYGNSAAKILQAACLAWLGERTCAA